jgi:hypothetical protein
VVVVVRVRVVVLSRLKPNKCLVLLVSKENTQNGEKTPK